MARRRLFILCVAAIASVAVLAWQRRTAGVQSPLHTLYLAGVHHAERGELPAAEAILKQVVVANPVDADSHAELGNVYLRQGLIFPAIQALETASFLRPDRPHVYCQLAEAYVMARLADEAHAALETALRNHPDCPHAHAVRGEQFFWDDNLTAALKEFRATMRLAPGFILSYEKAGHILLQLERLPEAEEVLQQGLSRDPVHPGLHYLLARVYERRTGDAAARLQAEAHYRKALQGHPAASAIHAALGRLASRRGDAAAARGEWETALRRNRNQADALYGMAELASREGRVGDARVYRSRYETVQQFSRRMDALRTRAEARPDDTGVGLEIALLGMEAGFNKESENQLNRIIEREPEHRRARELRAQLWLDAGRTEDAHREFAVASRLKAKSR